MISKRNARYFVMVLLLLCGLYFYFVGNPSSEKVAPNNTTETLPSVEKATPNEKTDENSTKIEKQPKVSPIPSEGSKIERSPTLTPAHGESVNLEEQSYSIKNEKKEIPITPGVSLQPGKSVNVKVPGEEEFIRVQRDKVYHPGGYNVLLEKKF